ARRARREEQAQVRQGKEGFASASFGMVARIAFDAGISVSHNRANQKTNREVRKRWQRRKRRAARAAEKASRRKFNRAPISRRSPAASPSPAAKSRRRCGTTSRPTVFRTRRTSA